MRNYLQRAFAGVIGLAILCIIAPAAQGQAFNLLHSFEGFGGVLPASPFIQTSDGALYSTTRGGFGEVYQVTPSGSFTIIHSFQYSDGYAPGGALLLIPGGTFYGTSQEGGSQSMPGFGVIYKLTTAGEITVLHVFNVTDGWSPNGGLLVGADGALYGTTEYGGTNSTGTIFKIGTDGTFKNLYNFSAAGTADGAYPITPLILGTDGAFYGIAGGGGANGHGAVFKYATSGPPTVLYSFAKSDGLSYLVWPPYPALAVGQDGTLYGATSQGGANGTGSAFSLSTAGKYTTLYSFSPISGNISSNPTNADGMDPVGLTFGLDGALYGVAFDGGASGGGTVFRLTTSGQFTLLYAFSQPAPSNTDGWAPWAAPIMAADGNVYGTASNGGSGGQGTVYQISLPAYVMSVGVSPISVVGGNTSTVTVTLTKPAPADGAVVKLTSSSKSAVPPASITIAAGQTSGQGTIKTSAVSSVTSATITASDGVSSGSAVLKIVPPGVASVALNPASVVGTKNSTATVTLSGPAPAGGISVALSSGSSYASVPSSITVGAGKSSTTATVTTKRVTSDTSATIKATYGSTSVSASLAITVQTFTVTPSAGSNGSISPSTAQTVNYGDSISLTATPQTGYKVNQWVLDGKAVSGATGTTYKLSNVTANHTVKVTFVVQMFTITPSAGSNGSINPSTVQTVKYGGSTTFKATPASGYKVNQWTLDGKTVQTGDSSYTLSGVTANHTVKVSFK
jgi:uncharacterized repeat protein (TIGR03803 family)